MIKAILFDLDGTLLPMDQETFIKAYMYGLVKKVSQYGYEPDRFIQTIWNCISKMIKNDGIKTNEEVFWDTFSDEYGNKNLKNEGLLNDFYSNEFQLVSNSCGYTIKAKETIELVKKKGYKVVLATNPVFPSIATESRMKWAGLETTDFDLYTTYENSKYSKPNLEYYEEILSKINCLPQECLMVGNDVDEDMIVSSLGMKTFLLTDCLINKNNEDISKYDKGSYDDLIKYLNELQ